MEQLGKRATRIVGREDTDDLAVLDDDGRSIFVLCKRLDDDIQASVRRHGVDVARHGFLHGDLRRVYVAQCLHEMQIALGDDADQLAPFEHGQVANLMCPHHRVCPIERLVFANRMWARRHELVKRRNRFAHGALLSSFRAQGSFRALFGRFLLGAPSPAARSLHAMRVTCNACG